MSKDANVAALQVGDKVMYHDGQRQFESVVQVSKRTATQVVLSNGVRVNNRGRIIGAGVCSRSYVLPWSAECEERSVVARRRYRSVRRMASMDWNTMTDETLAACVAVLDAIPAVKDAA